MIVLILGYALISIPDFISKSWTNSIECHKSFFITWPFYKSFLKLHLHSSRPVLYRKISQDRFKSKSDRIWPLYAKKLWSLLIFLGASQFFTSLLIQGCRSRKGGGALCVEMGFYADISWKSRCNIEINVWVHFYKILLVCEVPYRPRVKWMPGKA